MIRWWYKLYHPDIFQGHLSKGKYFEGWYIKLVSPDERHALAVIPGVALYDHSDRHAFIQVIDGVRQETSYHKFSTESFSADRKVFSVQIGANKFSTHEVILDLPELSGKIQFLHTTPLESSVFNPGIMGWYSFVPTMECYHGIVSLHHTLEGKTKGSYLLHRKTIPGLNTFLPSKVLKMKVGQIKREQPWRWLEPTNPLEDLCCSM
jgi:tocopherol cyclase